MDFGRNTWVVAALAGVVWTAPAVPAAALVRPVVHAREFAQSVTPPARQAAPAPQDVQAVDPGSMDDAIPAADADDLRRQLEQLLRQYPPSLQTVLRADPALIADQAYLSTYPELARFVARHPQVARDARFYLGDPREPQDAQAAAIDMWRNTFESMTVMTVFVVVCLALGWLVRTTLDYRRWLRASKVQVEVHQKLFDRLSSNDDLMRYIQTPAGQRFLDSAPISVDAGPRAAGVVSAPVSRILWSVQIGVVLAAGGVGLQWVSTRVPTEVGQFLSFVGVMALMLGVGFVASAGVAYVISRRLGLLAGSPAVTDRGAAEHPL